MTKRIEFTRGPLKGQQAFVTYEEGADYLRVTPVEGDPLTSIELSRASGGFRHIPHTGDYYLMPYAGEKINLLVRAVRPHGVTTHWYVESFDGRKSERLALLESCEYCPPAVAAELIGEQDA